jgi:hypothetical protein
MLKYLWSYCPRSCSRIRPQIIDQSANNIPVITNRLYIDTYLLVINIEYLSQRLICLQNGAEAPHVHCVPALQLKLNEVKSKQTNGRYTGQSELYDSH